MMRCLNAWKTGLIAVLAAGLPASAVAMQWPDTAQTVCYDNTKEIPCPNDENSPFYGQDAQFQGPVRSYTKLGQGGVELPDDAAEWIMVRDNVTGLIWEMKNIEDDTEDYSNPHDVDNKYYWCFPDINGTGYCLQDIRNDQEDFLTALNNKSFGGYNDWRIPTINELSSLFYAGKSPTVDWKYFRFNSETGAYYWTNTMYPTNSYPWVINFTLEAYHIYGDFFTSYHIYAVRGGK